jgi:glycosyltransferase involved in cell wall biosynthesis
VEIIVVDNYSTDRTSEIAERWADQVVLAGPERSAQRNAGANTARSNYLLFVDSDMALQPAVVRECMRLAGPKAEAKAAVIPENSEGEGF